MLNVPVEIQELFKQDSISKNFRVTFPNGEYRDLVNADFVSESVVYTESLNSSNGLIFGNSERSSIEFKMYFTENIKNKIIYCEIEIDLTSLDSEIISEYGITSSDVPYPYYPVPYGYFLVTACQLQNSNIQSVNGVQVGSIANTSYFNTEKAKMLHPLRLKDWADVEYDSTHDYAYKIAKRKYMCELSNSCSILEADPVETFTEADSILSTKSVLKVANCPMSTLKWIMPAPYIVSSNIGINEAYSSGLPKDVTIHVKGIKLQFDVSHIMQYQYNQLGLPVSSSRRLTTNFAQLPAKDYIYELSWRNSSQINKYSFNHREIYDVLGKEFFDELIKPCLTFEYFPAYSNSAQIQEVNYPDKVATYVGSDFAVVQNCSYYESQPYDPETRWTRYNIGSSLKFLGKKSGYTSTNTLDFAYDRQTLTDTSIPSERRFIFRDITNITPTVDDYTVCGRDNFQYKNAILFGMYSSQRIQNIEPYTDDVGNNRIIINPYMHIYDATLDENIEHHTKDNTGLFPHISVCIPTELVVVYGTDKNKDVVDCPFDMCAYFPTGSYTSQTIKVNDWTSPTLKKYYVADNVEDITVRMEVGKVTFPSDSTFISSFDEDPGNSQAYLTYAERPVDSHVSLNDKSIRCSPDTIANLDVGSSDNIRQITELDAAFVKFNRYPINDYRVFELTDALLFPSDNMYSSLSLYPSYNQSSDISIIDIPTSLWYKFSIDTLENISYDKVCCTTTLGGESVYLESYIVSEQMIKDNPGAYKHYDVSNNELIKNGAYSMQELQEILDNMAATIRGIYYTVVTIQMKGLPYVEAGDKLWIDVKSSRVSSYVLRQRITGIQSLITTVENR